MPLILIMLDEARPIGSVEDMFPGEKRLPEVFACIIINGFQISSGCQKNPKCLSVVAGESVSAEPGLKPNAIVQMPDVTNAPGY